ncbi:unnamed protein product [Meloidogyne enterolobii]|uniref:Uncharacterized protein n=1 Tax=Meloidogyne enterolobii TaxID=390850 RepID=A0ACB0YZY5_MELEN
MAILRCLKLDSCTILLIITNILLQITPASTETAILKAHYPLTLPSASFVDPSILRRKRLEANAAAVRQQLQHQRDVQVENVGGLLGPLPSINTGNDATGRVIDSIQCRAVMVTCDFRRSLAFFGVFLSFFYKRISPSR